MFDGKFSLTFLVQIFKSRFAPDMNLTEKEAYANVMCQVDWKAGAAVLLIVYLSLCYSKKPYQHTSENSMQAISTIVLIFVTFVLLGSEDGGISYVAACPVVFFFLLYSGISMAHRSTSTRNARLSRSGGGTVPAAGSSSSSRRSASLKPSKPQLRSG